MIPISLVMRQIWPYGTYTLQSGGKRLMITMGARLIARLVLQDLPRCEDGLMTLPCPALPYAAALRRKLPPT
jgi:hypothetical protein